MENFKFEVDGKQIKEQYNIILNEVIAKALTKEKENIESVIKLYFDRGIFKDKISKFDVALDWVIEAAFREGLEKAMNKLNIKEIIADKAKEMLSDNNYLKDLADAKIRASLGLPKHTGA